MQGLCKLVRNLPSGSDLKAEELACLLRCQNDGNLIKSACTINALNSSSYTWSFALFVPPSATLMVVHEVYLGNECKTLKISHMTETYNLSEGHFVQKWDHHPHPHTWTDVWRNVSSWWHGDFHFMHQFFLRWKGCLPFKRLHHSSNIYNTGPSCTVGLKPQLCVMSNTKGMNPLRSIPKLQAMVRK